MDPDLACHHTPTYFTLNLTYFMTVDRYLYVQYTLLILYDSQPRFRIYSIPLCQALEGSGGTSSAAATAVSAVHEGRNPGMVLVGPGGFMMT